MIKDKIIIRNYFEYIEKGWLGNKVVDKYKQEDI